MRLCFQHNVYDYSRRKRLFPYRSSTPPPPKFLRMSRSVSGYIAFVPVSLRLTMPSACRHSCLLFHWVSGCNASSSSGSSQNPNGRKNVYVHVTSHRRERFISAARPNHPLLNCQTECKHIQSEPKDSIRVVQCFKQAEHAAVHKHYIVCISQTGSLDVTQRG